MGDFMTNDHTKTHSLTHFKFNAFIEFKITKVHK